LSDQNPQILITIAVIGGTGKEGSGLAKRWASCGYRVIIGSRDAQRAQEKADEINRDMGGTYLHGTDNLSAAQEADLVVISVPYDAHDVTVEAIRDAVQGKIIIDVSVPLMPPDIRTVHVPQGYSACLETQNILGSGVKVVAAFQNVSAVHLKEVNHEVDCDVLVCGDDDDAKKEVIKLAQAAGMRGLDAGPLANAVAVEAMTPVLLWFNKRYKVKGAGLIITGIDEGAL
jgi:8-hydroxy-5-deazaflavin:NADPH oxidoreductase